MQDSRRKFLKVITAVGGESAALSISAASFAAPSLAASFSCEGEEPSTPDQDFIKVKNPRELWKNRVPVERISVGVRGLYKPCIAKLGGNGLLLVCYDPRVNAAVYDCPVYQFHSKDGGRTWRGGERLAVDDSGHGGGEPYLFQTQKGSLLMTGGPWGYRSEDGGQTWAKQLQPESFAESATCNVTRNMLQLEDGSILQIVDVSRTKASGVNTVPGHEFIARSFDDGRSWPEVYPSRIQGMPKGYNSDSVFDEAYLFQLRSGKLYAIARVDSRFYPLPGRILAPLEIASANLSTLAFGVPPVSNIPQPWNEGYFDNFDRLKVFSSEDMGRTWQPGPDLGDYGYMYPAILRLQGGGILLTYTVRAIDPPLGVRAVIGKENGGDVHFDFKNDVIMIDTKTPIGRCSGGGYGPTIQLDDGTLVTSYSYWPPDDKRKAGDWSPPNPSQCEVVRWRLPAS